MWVFSVLLPLPDGSAKTRIVFISVSSILFLSSIDWPSIKSWPKTHTIGRVVEVNMSDHSICNLPSFRSSLWMLISAARLFWANIKHTWIICLCVVQKSYLSLHHYEMHYLQYFDQSTFLVLTRLFWGKSLSYKCIVTNSKHRKMTSW